jgi:hypothetical protein
MTRCPRACPLLPLTARRPAVQKRSFLLAAPGSVGGPVLLFSGSGRGSGSGRAASGAATYDLRQAAPRQQDCRMALAEIGAAAAAAGVAVTSAGLIIQLRRSGRPTGAQSYERVDAAAIRSMVDAPQREPRTKTEDF